MEKNMSIGCNVCDCEYHHKSEDYCTLSHIQVVQHDAPANSCEQTDCSSFKKCNC